MTGNICHNRGNWLYQRLLDPRPIDIVFIGTSHFIQSVNEDTLALHMGIAPASIANLGHCLYGRDMQYLILKELLKKHDPKLVVIEVREEEVYIRHSDFACFCSPIDFFEVLPFFKGRRALIKEALSCRVRSIQRAIFKHPYNSNHTVTRGFRSGKGVIEPKKALAARDKHSAIQRSAKLGNEKFPFYYLEKMQALCQDRNTEVRFLYIPDFNSAEKPQHLLEYEKMGKVLLPPRHLITDPNNYFEFNHLNTKAAGWFSRWLADNL